MPHLVIHATIQYLAKNATALAAAHRPGGPGAKIFHELDDCYRIHVMGFLSNIIHDHPDYSKIMGEVVATWPNVKWDPSSLWLTIEKAVDQRPKKGTMGAMDIEHMANKTSGAYSASRYGDVAWRKAIQLLAEAGYTEIEVEEILRSKYMRWAADCFAKRFRDREVCVGTEIMKYKDQYGIDVAGLLKGL